MYLVETDLNKTNVSGVIKSPNDRSFQIPTLLGDIRNELVQSSTMRLVKLIELYLKEYAGTPSGRFKLYDLNYFLTFITSVTGLDPNSIVIDSWTEGLSLSFIDHQLQADVAPATICRRLATLKHCDRWLANRISGYYRRTLSSKNPSYKKELPQSLSVAQVSLLRELTMPMSWSNYAEARRYFVIELLLQTGLRGFEACNLRRGQISADGKWLKNVRGKGRSFRNVFMPSLLRELLPYFLASRERVLEKHKERIAPNSDEKDLPLILSTQSLRPNEPYTFHLSTDGLRDIFYSIEKESRGTLSVRPHQLRHTFATRLISAGVDIRAVCQAMGHADIKTTMIYTERSEEDLAVLLERLGEEL